ncbi:MAG: hypothetical protein CFE27_00315 [Alphaproteobacteria bacterium PA1]|nr:MAG: hypothetical protein CFE27_00315 [Alphaproteobacteria bacterium PA1]
MAKAFLVKTIKPKTAANENGAFLTECTLRSAAFHHGPQIERIAQHELRISTRGKAQLVLRDPLRPILSHLARSNSSTAFAWA